MDIDSWGDGERAASNNHSREMMPLPPPLRKGSADIERNREETGYFTFQISDMPMPIRLLLYFQFSGDIYLLHLTHDQISRKSGDHPHHAHHVRVPHHHERPMFKKQRRHSEHDMTKRTLDSIKGERNDSDDQEDGDVDVDDFDDDEERGVSPPTQTENVPPPPTATAAALTTR